ncbi:MAG: class I SAM-dependent methyltransferase, partial [Bacteroidia bacterium]
LLYKNRDYSEAELFIDNLLSFLKPEQGARFLDIGCGKGRHSIYLNKKGFDVTGIDLAENSISCAKQSENEHLHFYVHDMRKIFRTNYFDYAVNLFTSFGYFENNRDNNTTISTIQKSLKPKGIFILDFMNAKKVISYLNYQEIKTIEGIEFKITKKVENNFIIKQIQFTDKGKEYNFKEFVKALTLADFEGYFSANKFKILHLLGNYQLDVFDENTSDRLIIIAEKE